MSRTSARRLSARLAVLGAVTLVVSASWMVVVDAWPASDRPYIGGSTNNTVLDLALGYNGFGRVDGRKGAAAGCGWPATNTSQRLPDGTTTGERKCPANRLGYRVDRRVRAAPGAQRAG